MKCSADHVEELDFFFPKGNGGVIEGLMRSDMMRIILYIMTLIVLWRIGFGVASGESL